MATLTDKNIIITGGSLGIGLKIAEFCLREGANIIICARNISDLESAKNVLFDQFPSGNIEIFPLDVSNLEAINQFKNTIVANKTIHGLVNSAGVYGPIGKTTEVDMEQFAKAININFLGTVFMCNAIAKYMPKDGSARIVNLAGGGAASPFANYSAYACSKVAIVRFSENLALELLEDNIAVNAVAPGFVITRLHQNTIEVGAKSAGTSFLENTLKQIESGGVPADIAAELTVFLLGNKSEGITGKFISAPWDPWQSEDFITHIKADNDFATLRRIDNKSFFKSSK